MKIPVLVCAYNRPLHTSRVLEQLQRINATRVFIHLDGESFEESANRENILKTRKLVQEFTVRNKSWKLLIENDNLRLRKSMTSALNWFFELNEFGIVLEDDCYPSQDFFDYSEAAIKLLKSTDIATFSGTRFSPWRSNSTSKTPITYVWGWGTTREIWLESIKAPLQINPEFIQSNLKALGTEGSRLSSYWIKILSAQCFADNPELMEINGYTRNDIGKSLIDSTRQSWDYTFVLSLLAGNNTNRLLYSLRPPVNLISNSGFGLNSTHFIDSGNRLSRKIHALRNWRIDLRIRRISESYERILVFGNGNWIARRMILISDWWLNR